MDDNLHMRFGIPLWAFGMKGDLSIEDQRAAVGTPQRQVGGHVNKDFWDFFDQLDFIAPISIDLRKGRFYFHTEVIYVKTSEGLEPRGAFAGSGANGDLTTKLAMGGINVGYEFVRQPKVTLTGFVGGRMTYVDATININAPGAGVAASASKSKFIGDPVIGLLGTWDFTKSLGVFVKGDVGGFGLIGDHFTWQAEPGFEWRISPHTYLQLEWRWLSTDFSKDRFNYDVQLMGPQAEFGWRF